MNFNSLVRAYSAKTQIDIILYSLEYSNIHSLHIVIPRSVNTQMYAGALFDLRGETA